MLNYTPNGRRRLGTPLNMRSKQFYNGLTRDGLLLLLLLLLLNYGNNSYRFPDVFLYSLLWCPASHTLALSVTIAWKTGIC
jgi:hypothetical protein